jgi:hypothetical protein
MIVCYPQSILTLPTYTLLCLLTLVGFATGRCVQIQRGFMVNVEVLGEGCTEHFVLPSALFDTSWGVKGDNRMKTKHYWGFPFKNSNSEVEKVVY